MVGNAQQLPIVDVLDVAIIGAGVAGLACVARLMEQGGSKQIAVFEADTKFGGRTCSVNVGGFSVDSGAAWIHGIEGNPLVEDGVINPDDIVECAEANIWIHGPSVRDSSNFHPAPEDVQRWQRRLSAISDDVQDLVKTLRSTSEEWTASDERFLKAFELWFGAPASDISAVEWCPKAQLGDFAGPHAVVRKGMSQIAERLVQCSGCKDRLYLNTCVEKVEEQDDLVTLHLQSDGHSSKVQARWVVCTVSLGVLQQGRLAIIPAVTTRMINAMSHLSMSAYCKCIVALPEGIVQELPTWNWTDHSLFPMVFNYFAVTGKPILVFTSIYQAVGSMSDEAVLSEALGAIGIDVVTVTGFYVTRWHSHCWSEGSYSYSRHGCDFSEVDTFLTEMQNRRIIFAGEHTDDQYQGSVHGAYLSGKRAADHICERSCKQNSPC